MKHLLHIIALAALLLPAPVAAQSLTVPQRSMHRAIEVHAEPGLEPLAAEVAERAPGILAELRHDLRGLPVPERVEIRLVKRARDMNRAAPEGAGRVPEWASGVAFPGAGVVVVATRRGAHPIDVHDTVAHELAHLALGAALGGRAPRWLDEGFAYVHSADWSLERVRTLTGMVWFGNTMPLYRLEHGFPARESLAHRAYAQSYDFVAFLVRRGRYPDANDDGNRWPFRRFLAEIAGGKSTDQAAWAAYGAGLGELFEEWRANLRDRYLLIPVGMVSSAVWALAALLLVAGYLRRRRLARLTLERWEREEAVAQAATEAATQTLH